MKEDLEHHYRLFNCIVFSRKFYGSKVKSIRKKIRILCGYKYGISYEFEPHHVRRAMVNERSAFVVEELFDQYLNKQHYKEYDPEFSLSTFIQQFIFLNINNLLRKEKRRSEAEGINPRSDLCDPDNSNFLISYEEHEDWLDVPSSKMDNPEDLLQVKQLLGLMLDHFGREDLYVFLGIESKETIVQHSNISKEYYTKKLYLKRVAFRPVAIRNGYEYC